VRAPTTRAVPQSAGSDWGKEAVEIRPRSVIDQVKPDRLGAVWLPASDIDSQSSVMSRPRLAERSERYSRQWLPVNYGG
jgi:hypothetical protein